ncbi:MAG TPA: ATP-binding protein [Nocardioidaceae bacterium]|nr:ATP-binding protein [Nocardioidaceae bacterium]
MSSATSRELTTLRRLHHLMNQVNASHDLEEVLQTVAEGVADVVGFEVAAIRYLRSDGDLECVAVAGDETARAQLLGTRIPVAEIQAEFEMADEWGALRFVPHERLRGSVGAGWIPDVPTLDVPDAWHPEDALIAPLSSPTGELAGVLSVDLPHDGRRPGQFQREVLEMYSVQAGIAINNAWQRARLAEQVRLAEVLRTITQTAGRALDLGRVLDECVEPVVTGLGCHGIWIRAFEGEGERPGIGRGAIHPRDFPVEPSDELLALAKRVAHDCWADRRAVIFSDTKPAPSDLVSVDEQELLFRFVGHIHSRTVLFVPMGAGRECLGYIALTRTAEDAAWSDEEVDAALEIGRDLGRAVLHARLFERERQIVEELQDLDHYKTELISTVSHELRNPLTAIVGHVELLQMLDGPPETERSLAAIARGSARLELLVDDLLMLSKVSDPHRPLIPQPVDMVVVATEAVDMFCLQASRQNVEVRLVVGSRPVFAWGEPAELDRAVCNIVSNAVKYSPAGGQVTLTLEVLEGLVVVECRDQGMGISEADQVRLFTEFYRSSNADAIAMPGTGLGLTIVKRIVDRHRGTLTVESELGRGSTFRMMLPQPPK